jgi:hypothetical protein
MELVSCPDAKKHVAVCIVTLAFRLSGTDSRLAIGLTLIT